MKNWDFPISKHIFGSCGAWDRYQAYLLTSFSKRKLEGCLLATDAFLVAIGFDVGVQKALKAFEEAIFVILWSTEGEEEKNEEINYWGELFGWLPWDDGLMFEL